MGDNAQRTGYLPHHKVHVITAHFKQQIERSGFKPISFITDQTIEVAHSLMKKRMQTSKYFIKDITLPMHGMNLLKCLLHINV